ncbi:hypothetical protein [Absidia glauca]|uniref:Uncharacterized protein n=1 Tax=Absidia glauca TaxID=4829 RepID=A0A163MKV9_ABSGL|nr:hypothetical protein [Absidia glauca]
MQTRQISSGSPTMKVIDKIKKAEEEGRIYWSFEYFPPKTAQGTQNLYDRIDRMKQYGPEFIDLTWGAGGSSAKQTIEIVKTAQSVSKVETMMHLTCTNMPVEMVDEALKAAKDCGCQNILALRGDPPHGQDKWESCEGGFNNAIDLVKYIRLKYGDYFGIAVAGHPEGHIDNPSKEDDLKHLKDKVDAGADLIVTQLFYDVDMFLDFVTKCRAIGITCPIVPGVFPIQNYQGLKRVISFNDNYVPESIWNDLEPIKDDDAAVKEYGIQLTIQFIEKMLAAGIKGVHFYTFNLERSTRLILERLNLIPAKEEAALTQNTAQSSVA